MRVVTQKAIDALTLLCLNRAPEVATSEVEELLRDLDSMRDEDDDEAGVKIDPAAAGSSSIGLIIIAGVALVIIALLVVLVVEIRRR